MKEKFLPYLRARLRERSTWLGLIGVASALGATISPDAAEHIVAIGIGLAGGALAVTPDKPASPTGE